jgi:tRNA (guanine37-N1)-methyltransferase
MGDSRLEFEVFSLFPALIDEWSKSGLLGKAVDKGVVAIHVTNFRDFSQDKHRTVDDTPFGGGAGMVMKPDPVVAALEHVARERGPFHRVLLTPSAPRFDQRAAQRLAGKGRVGLLCGRYEGIDDRVREGFVDEVVSIGDFVLNGGEAAAVAIIEAVSRLHEGVLGNPDSARHESYSDLGLGAMLEHPHYTRPAEFRGRTVPPVLTAGDHAAIDAWRRVAACARTWQLRPELRPHRELGAGHSLALISDPPLTPSRVDALRAESPGLRWAGAPDKRSALLSRLRRELGAKPWMVGLGQPPRRAESAGFVAQEEAELIDLLVAAKGSPAPEIPPLALVWPPTLAGSLGAELWFDPRDVGDARGSRLASDPSLIESSQPESPPASTALTKLALGSLAALDLD